VVEGEISQIAVKNRNLVFATIKDSKSAIDVFALTHQVRNLAELEVGMKVHVEGTAGLYKGSGRFRLQAVSITPHGEGSLERAYELLKNKLESEGLFDASHKRTLPEWPQNIGLITAPGSSALEDLIKIAGGRMGGITLKIIPVTVQGNQAASSILKAFEYSNAHTKEFDLLILARGGGSLEDLHAFNTEEVARTVFSSSCPVISAVGHENDWTLVDYVADHRASTPSNAMQIALRDRQEVLRELEAMLSAVRYAITAKVNLKKNHIDQLLNRINRTLARQITGFFIQLDKIEYLRKGIVYQSQTRIRHIDFVKVKLSKRMQHAFHAKRQEFDNLNHLIHTLSPENILKRGFSITTDSKGKIIKKSTDMATGQNIRTQLASGRLLSIITKV
jgi:exodeoxyribonuclease VII large subunit